MSAAKSLMCLECNSDCFLGFWSWCLGHIWLWSRIQVCQLSMLCQHWHSCPISARDVGVKQCFLEIASANNELMPIYALQEIQLQDELLVQYIPSVGKQTFMWREYPLQNKELKISRNPVKKNRWLKQSMECWGITNSMMLAMWWPQVLKICQLEKTQKGNQFNCKNEMVKKIYPVQSHQHWRTMLKANIY